MKRTPLAIAALIAASTLARGAEFRMEGKTFVLPDGFTLEKVAGPPLVDRPIVADFDEKGRLYVADSSGSNEPVKIQLEKKPHRIVRLEDSDGDGKYDRRTIFADRMMFPEGCMWLEGSLYVAAPPQIWKLTDTDDNGVADRREVWFDGKTLTGCANDLHGPYRGPDGWIYWCKGAFAEQKYERPGKPPFVTRASHIFRARPDGTGIEPVMTGGMDNPVDVVFTPGGEPIFSCTFLQHPAEGRRDGLIHAVYGGVWGKDHDVLNGHARTSPELLPVMTQLGPAAPCGLTRYESKVFGDDFKDNLFACQFNLRKVSRHVLVPDGSTYRTIDSDFLVSDDHDFHPTDVQEDADGSLLVVDTGGWYKICCPTSQLEKPDVLGAIYRIRKVGAPKVEDPRGLKLAWDHPTTEWLDVRLYDERPAVRRRALEALAARPREAARQLPSMLFSTEPPKRSATIALATRLDGPEARSVRISALSGMNIEVLPLAIHAVGLRRDRDAVPMLVEILRSRSVTMAMLDASIKDGGPYGELNKVSLVQKRPILRAAAEALGRIGDRSAVPAILETLAEPTDRVLDHSLTYALIEIADPSSTAKGLESKNPAVRRAAMVALDQMDGGGLKAEQVIPSLDSGDPALRESAAWIVGHHPEWGGALAGWVRERIHAPSKSEAERDAFLGHLGRLARSPEIRELIGATLADPEEPAESRRIALRAVARAGLKAVPASWVEGLRRSLESSDPTLVAEAVATVRALAIKPDPGKPLVEPLRAIADRATLPTEVRLGALAATPGGAGGISDTTFDLALADLKPDRPVASRLLAAEALARADLDRDQLASLAHAMGDVGPLEVDRLLPAFEKSREDAVGIALIEALGRSSAIGALRPDMIRPRLAKYGPAVREKAERLYTTLNVDAEAQKARVDELLATLPKGEIRRGQAVFNGTKAACLSCHAVGYVGGKVGPDLSSIGKVRQPRDLIESIVYPSASFVRSYEPAIVELKDGRSFSGLIQREESETIFLATGPGVGELIPRDAIEEIRPGTVSVMPAGLDGQLSRQELADLLAFLLSRR